MKQRLLTLLVALCVAVGAYAFEFGDLTYNVTSNVEPYTVEVARQSSYNNYPGLTSVTIPETVTYNGKTYTVTGIGERAFQNCSDLTSVIIPEGVTSLGDYAFFSCRGLASITIPETVTSIGDVIFCYCTSLKSLIIPDAVEKVGVGAFMSSGIESITFGKGLTSIRAGVFDGCKELTSIVVAGENSVYDSRNNCNAIIETATNELITGCKTTVIPNDVTSIGFSAFSQCLGLESIVIPEGVTEIKAWAFDGCTGLTSVSIPSTVTEIGNVAFANCTALKSMICLAEVPPTCTEMTFDGVPGDIPLYVPDASVGAYKADFIWWFFDIRAVSDIPSGIKHITNDGRLPSRKVIRDGQVLILYNGKVYTLTGQEIR